MAPYHNCAVQAELLYFLIFSKRVSMMWVQIIRSERSPQLSYPSPSFSPDNNDKILIIFVVVQTEPKIFRLVIKILKDIAKNILVLYGRNLSVQTVEEIEKSKCFFSVIFNKSMQMFLWAVKIQTKTRQSIFLELQLITWNNFYKKL